MNLPPSKKKRVVTLASLTAELLRGSISPNFFWQTKNLSLSKNRLFISPTIKTPTFELKLWHFLPNLFAVRQTLHQKKVSHPMRSKKPWAYVDEIDPWAKLRIYFEWLRKTKYLIGHRSVLPTLVSLSG